MMGAPMYGSMLGGQDGPRCTLTNVKLAGCDRSRSLPDIGAGMEQHKSDRRLPPDGAAGHAKSTHASAVKVTFPAVLLGDVFMVCNTLSGILATSVGTRTIISPLRFSTYSRLSF